MASAPLPVVWTEGATGDIEAIAAWIAEDSPGDARRVLRRLRDRAKALDVLPRRGRVVPELRWCGIDIWREVVVRPYRIVYRVDERAFVVMGVLDGRRSLEDILLERLLRPSH